MHVCKYEMMGCLPDRGRLRAYIVFGKFVQGIDQDKFVKGGINPYTYI